jgi:hypothetical protein
MPISNISAEKRNRIAWNERTGKAPQNSSLEGATNRIAQLQIRTQPERQEARPVTRGQRPAKSWRRPRGHGADARHCRRVSTKSGAPLPTGRTEPGEETSLKIPIGNGWDGPVMRPKLRFAAESGVGKHTAP